MGRLLSSLQSSIHEIVFGEPLKPDPAQGRGGGASAAGYESDSTIAENSPLLVRSAKAPSLDQLTSDHLALIVDGETLLKIFGDAESEKLFLSVARICKSVIACRVSPEQKRLMVRLVKRGVHPRPVTLSIGDGANDVAMIQEAQVGVGISGKEGRQAVNSSDFAIAQFRFLKRLMLVHGRTDYRRTCKVVLYSFYKNIVLTLVLFAFTFYSGFSGQSLFDDYVYSSYNIVLAAPVVAFGIFDVDISFATLEKYNFLYVSGREGLDMNVPVLLKEMLQAIFDAALVFFVPYFCYSDPADVWAGPTFLGTDNAGKSAGIWVFGTTIFTVMVISMFLRAAMLTFTWTYITHICFWGSVALYVLFLFTYQYYYNISYNYYMVTSEMTSHPIFWLLCLVVPALSGIVELVIRMVRRLRCSLLLFPFLIF
jgi:magnesium-transporting ATPase (P-type)